jgi:hypothetical protein
MMTKGVPASPPGITGRWTKLFSGPHEKVLKQNPPALCAGMDIHRLWLTIGLGLTSRPTVVAWEQARAILSRRFASGGPARVVTPVALAPRRLRHEARPDWIGYCAADRSQLFCSAKH